MGAKGEQTREHILATAESLILQRGYVGTSIEEIIGQAGITKGGFFYHFGGKSDLAHKLIVRFLEQDELFFRSLIARSEDLSEDPLQQFLIFLKLLAEAMADLPGAHPGCLVAAFTYESHQFDEDIRQLNAEGMLSWRRIFLEQLQKIVDHRPMKNGKPIDELADMLTSVLEGAMVMSKCLDDKDILPQQVLQFRNYVRLVFGDV